MFILVRDLFTYNNKPNQHAEYDTGQAVAHMTVQAWHLNIMAHQMGGFSAEKVAASFSLPEGHRPLVAMALGYLGDPNTLSEEQRESELGPRTRRSLDDTLSNGTHCLKND